MSSFHYLIFYQLAKHQIDEGSTKEGRRRQFLHIHRSSLRFNLQHGKPKKRYFPWISSKQTANSFIKLQPAKAQTHLLHERRRFSSSYPTRLLLHTGRLPISLSTLSHAHVNHAQLQTAKSEHNHKSVKYLSQPLFRGRARTQVPTTRNYTLELPTFGVIARVNPVQVQ